MYKWKYILELESFNQILLTRTLVRHILRYEQSKENKRLICWLISNDSLQSVNLYNNRG